MEPFVSPKLGNSKSHIEFHVIYSNFEFPNFEYTSSSMESLQIDVSD